MTCKCRCRSCMFNKIRTSVKLEPKISAVWMQRHCSALLAQPYISKSQRILWCLQLQNLLGLGCPSELWGILRCGEFIMLLKSSCSAVCSGRGEGSVWPFTSFVHMQCDLGVPALLVALPKPWMLLKHVNNVQGRSVRVLCSASIIETIQPVFSPHLWGGCDSARLPCVWRGWLSFGFHKWKVWMLCSQSHTLLLSAQCATPLPRAAAACTSQPCLGEGCRWKCGPLPLPFFSSPFLCATGTRRGCWLY